MRTRRQSAAAAQATAEEKAEARTYLWGLVLYALSTVAGASTSVIVKLLGGVGGMSMPAMQLVLVRSCVLVAASLPALRHPAARALIAHRHDLLFVRGCLGFSSVALIYVSVRLLPLSEAVALAFLAPALVAALSPLLLHERPPAAVVGALALAAAGALAVAQPRSLAPLLPSGAAGGAAPSRLGVAAALGHAATAAGAKITVRSLALGTTSPHVAGAIVLSAGAVSAAASAAICVAQRSLVLPAAPAHWALLAGVAACGVLHQWTMTAGLQRVPVSAASTLTYLSIVWSVLADALLFHHRPSLPSLVGAAAIIAGGLTVAAWRVRTGFGSGGGGGGGPGGGGAGSVSKQEQLAILRM